MSSETIYRCNSCKNIVGDGGYSYAVLYINSGIGFSISTDKAVYEYHACGDEHLSKLLVTHIREGARKL